MLVNYPESAARIASFRQQYTPHKADTDKTSTRRTQIMEATVEIAAAEGVRGASLRKIAAKTGIRTASLYSYFPGGKDELVSTALAAALTSFYTYAATDLRPDDEPIENLRRLVFSHTRWTIINPRVAPAITVIERAHAIAPLMSLEVEQEIAKLHTVYRRMVVGLLIDLHVPEEEAVRLAKLMILVGDDVDTWAVSDSRYASDKPEEFAWVIVRRMIGLFG